MRVDANAARAGGEGRLGLVLPGGAALGAYEVGVLDYVVRDLAPALGGRVPLDVLCGTSVGACSAATLAAYADAPLAALDRLVRLWSSLRVDQVLRPQMLGALASWCAGRVSGSRRRVGGILKTRLIERLLRDTIPFERIDENLRRGQLSALSVSTTHVASGHTVAFVQTRAPLSVWTRDGTLTGKPATIGAEHLLASAAIPLLFPALRIDGELYCEGGLRQNVPLAPALQLGADRLLVVSPHHIAPPDQRMARARERAVSGPLFLLGRMLNALLLDRIDADVERLQQVNAILQAGGQAYGPRFASALERMHHPELPPLRLIESLLIRPSQPLGVIAGELVRSPRFRGRGLVGGLLRQIAAAEGTAEADLVSYLLFDGAFASQLIALGREDARRQHDALGALLEPGVRAPLRSSL